ncbi:unnamed protein product [Paramecium sonneborni]|uniref:H-type lectin domain-containing protein n=1 Tax=Paramecium sonneborni TaxID=65129 RepID=A0A8S1RV04_9CILI|nr:unnamed protein product [Paramecium sonneborni]
MKLLAAFSLLIMVFNFRIPQFDSGNAVGVSHSQGHILETQSYVPRQVVVYVQFSAAFETVPQVFISQNKVDSYEGSIGFNQRVGLITQKGFLVHSIALTSQSLIQLYFYWIAMCDDRVQVINFNTYDVKQLRTITGQREVLFQIDHNFQEATRGLISLNGVKFFYLTYLVIELKIVEITSQKITISGASYAQSLVDYISFSVLLGTDKSLWTSSLYTVINLPADYFPNIQIDFPSDYSSYTLTPLATWRGYSTDNRYNLRIWLMNVALNTKITYTFWAWGDSVVYAIFHSAGLYVFDTNHKIFDENCLELFSECDFQGESILVCQKIPNLSIKGWSKIVKSLTIPKQKTVNLFTKENYQGEKDIFTENQQCMASTVLSINFQPLISYIRILYLNNYNCPTVKFYSQCNFQGTLFQITKGQIVKQSNKIPFEIKSINICSNVVVHLKNPNYFESKPQEFTTSQSCITSYKFPKYVQPT